MKHTPGPWIYRYTAKVGGIHDCSIEHSVVRYGKGSRYVCRQVRTEGDARIMAASLDLLKACKVVQPLLLDLIRDHILGKHPDEYPETPISQKYKQLTDAIAKAQEFPLEIEEATHDNGSDGNDSNA